MPTFKARKSAAPPRVKIPGFKNVSWKRPTNKKPNVRRTAKAKNSNQRACSLGSILGFGFIFICVVSFSVFNSRQGQKPVHPPMVEMIDPHKGPMYAMTTQDEWCASIVNHHEPQEQFQLWPLMANMSLISRAGTYNHKHLILYPELIVRELNSTKRAALIICATEPTLLLIVDFNRSYILLSKTDAPCELTVQVNKETSRTAVYLCKPTYNDQCENPIEHMSARFSRLRIGSTAVPVAMLYSEQENEFMRSIRLSCKLMHNGKNMCWNPKTFSAEFCD